MDVPQKETRLVSDVLKRCSIHLQLWKFKLILQTYAFDWLGSENHTQTHICIYTTRVLLSAAMTRHYDQSVLWKRLCWRLVPEKQSVMVGKAADSQRGKLRGQISIHTQEQRELKGSTRG